MFEWSLFIVRLYYNQTLGHYSNRHGVEIRVPPPQFGGTESFEYVDPHLSDAAYFDKFVSYFEGLGYKKSYDIVGAAYDWRYGPGTASTIVCMCIHCVCVCTEIELLRNNYQIDSHITANLVYI